MERVRRVQNFGVPETDPGTNLDYFVADNGQKEPTAIPAIRFRPLEEVQHKLSNEYIPCYNDYQMVKDGQEWKLKVTPKIRTPIDIDFGWSELCEMTRNTVHDCLIPSAGFYFAHADVMPDLHIKLVNCTPKVMGFKPQERNKGVFDKANIQILYNQAAKAIDFTTENFVVPAIDPTFALVGCKNNFTQVIWTEEADAKSNAKGQDTINKAKQLGMIISSNIKKVTIDYKATSKWTHTVEIIFAFQDDLAFLE